VGQRLLAFLLTRDTLDVVPVALVARVEHLLRLLQFQLSWARPGAAHLTPASEEALLAAAQTHLSELYQELLAPLRTRLQADHLIFVPHDVLHYVPFHALYDGPQHLIDSFSVSYAPSATIYGLCHGRAHRAQRMRHRPQRHRRRGRAARAGAWAVPCRGGRIARGPLGGARPEHGGVHDRLLRPHPDRAQSGGRPEGRHPRNPEALPP